MTVSENNNQAQSSLSHSLEMMKYARKFKRAILRRRRTALMDKIPEDLSPNFADIYIDIIRFCQSQKEEGRKPPRVVVITDLAKDFDDLFAMVVLKELHRLEIIELLGFVANLEPAAKRARLGRGALDVLQLPNIPIGIGTNGEEGKKEHKVLDYEFAGSETFIAPKERTLPDGQELLLDLFQQAEEKKYKITLLTLSSLMDIAHFMEHHRDLLARRLERCVLQGGYNLEKDENGKECLKADGQATNNHFAMEAAQNFHNFLYEHKIPSMCFTKTAAFATPIYANFFKSLAATGVSIGEYLRDVQIGQDRYFWECASGPIEGRFRKFMDTQWFLLNKTSWYAKTENHWELNARDVQEKAAQGIRPRPLPQKDDLVTNWLDKLTAYDCLAAIGTSEELLGKLGVLKDWSPPTLQDERRPLHMSIVGPPTDPGRVQDPLKEWERNVNGDKFAQCIQALALGSLKKVAQEAATGKVQDSVTRTTADNVL